MSLPEPNFIDRDPNVIEQEWVSYFESISGKTLQPAQPERLLCSLGAYRESNVRIKIQEVAESLLVDYATAPILDYIGELVGKTRLAQSCAETTVQYTLSQTQIFDIDIPQGSIIESKDGKVSFNTMQDATIPAGQLSINIEAQCETAGQIGNGYLAGQICVMSDPIPYVNSVTNITTSSGGADTETNDAYIARIKLAPEEYSYGGKAAYKAWVESVSQDIIDVAVIKPNNPILLNYVINGTSYGASVNADNTISGSHITSGAINRVTGQMDIVLDNATEFHCTIPRGGEGDIYPLTVNENPSPELVEDIAAYLNDDTVIPLGDVISVLDPVNNDFQIVANVTASSNVDKPTLQTNIKAALATYTNNLKTSFSQNVLRAQIISIIYGISGVANLNLVSPPADILPADNEYTNCTNTSITVL